MKKISLKTFVLSLAALLLLGGNALAKPSISSISFCNSLDDDDGIVMMPSSAFDSGDIRFWFSPMSAEKSCRNIESQVFVVKAARNFAFKSTRLYPRRTDRYPQVEQVHVKKGDLLMMFDDVDMKGSSKVKIIFGQNFAMVNVGEICSSGTNAIK